MIITKNGLHQEFYCKQSKRRHCKTIRDNIAIKSDKPTTHHFLSTIQTSYLNNWQVPKDTMPC